MPTDVFAAAARLHRDGVPFVLATVVPGGTTDFGATGSESDRHR